MKLINVIVSLFKLDLDDKMELEERNRILLSNLYNFLMFLIVFGEGTYALLVEEVLYAAPLLLFSLLFLVNFLFLGRHARSAKYRTSLLTISYLSLGFFASMGGSSGMGAVWVLLFPFFVIPIFGKQKGMAHCLMMFALLVLSLFVLPLYIPGAPQYSMAHQIVIASLYLALVFVSYTLIYISNEIILDKEKVMLNSQNISRTQEEHISRLSHQIRTPLSNITGIINILEKSPLTDDQRDYINTIHASANNLVNVVNSIVNNQTAGLSQIPNEEISFNLYSIINNTLHLFSDEKKNTRFSISLSADIPTNVIGSGVKTKQILLNVLNSLLKQNKEEDKVLTIEVTRKENMPGIVDLTFKIISNQLLPIPSDSNSRESLYNQDIIRLNTSRYVHTLDLYITQRLIESDGNALNIYQKGDNIVVEFGVTFKENYKSQSIMNIQEQHHQRPEYVSKQKVDLKNANILLVEDNFSNQQIIILYIKNEVNRIDVAFNGKEALDKFGKAKYDLILMDVQMPIMDGFKATQKIREIELSSNTHTPIIAVTANAFPEDKDRCMAVGMDDYISKPFQPDDLISKIRKYLEQ
jgi:CheY-like chemotaxis protein/signal transduction histidine kinase